jgi:hypothetical protein
MSNESMKFVMRIKKDGTVITEVVDRGQHLCDAVYKVTNSIGKQMSDESLPDNRPDTVHEKSV